MQWLLLRQDRDGVFRGGSGGAGMIQRAPYSGGLMGGNMMELLARAGNLEIVKVAVESGANSIYVGPRGWSRRRDAYELSDDAVREAIVIAHDGGAKLRIAVNTNMQSREVPPLLEKMQAYVAWGVDGAIMTDLGAIAHVHRRFPHLAIHARIGAHILNKEDVKVY